METVTTVPNNAAQGRYRLWQTIMRYVAPAALMALLLYVGFTVNVRPPLTSDGNWGDVYRYQCFATMFWRGNQGLRDLPPTQCKFIIDTINVNAQILPQSHVMPRSLVSWMEAHSVIGAPFHTLPIEYPVVSLIPFSVPLLAPPADYALVFAIEMIVLTLIVYGVIARFGGWERGVLFALFMALGAFPTGAGRFDIVPAGLTLGALLLAERRRWLPAYVLLALATMLKFYPGLLIVPLLIAHVRSLPGERAWRRAIAPFALFAAICALLLAVSVAINPIETYRQFTDLAHRPIQVESVSGTLVWIGDRLGIHMTSYAWYGSDNVVSPLSPLASGMMTLVFVAAFVYSMYAFWKGRISQRRAWLLGVLLFVATGKILSDQYLIWVFPLLVMDMPISGFVPMMWLTVCALTTYNYPFLFHAVHGWHAVIAVRNALLVGLTALLLPLGWEKKPTREPDLTLDGAAVREVGLAREPEAKALVGAPEVS